LSETLVWLLYVLSGVAAFLAVYYTGWRIVPSMLAGALVTAVGWTLLYYVTPLDDRPAWFNVQLALNACLGLIFAGAGAAAAQFVVMKRNRADD
jgi:hypothetical protein